MRCVLLRGPQLFSCSVASSASLRSSRELEDVKLRKGRQQYGEKEKRLHDRFRIDGRLVRTEVMDKLLLRPCHPPAKFPKEGCSQSSTHPHLAKEHRLAAPGIPVTLPFAMGSGTLFRPLPLIVAALAMIWVAEALSAEKTEPASTENSSDSVTLSAADRLGIKFKLVVWRRSGRTYAAAARPAVARKRPFNRGYG